MVEEKSESVESMIDEVKNSSESSEGKEESVDEEGSPQEKEEAEEKGAKKAVEEMVEETREKVEAGSSSGEESGESKSSESPENKEKKSEESDKKDKKQELMERAKNLTQELDDSGKSEELKEKVKVKKRTDMLVPLEEYVKSGIYIGTKAVTPDMRPYVYRRRADGLAIFNTDIIDEKLKEGIEYLSQFKPEDIILVCKREAGWKAAKMFSEITGIRVFTKKYPSGILTNPELENFTENKVTIITDAWIDKNALNDTLIVNKDVFMIADTNNFSRKADRMVIGNNKSPRSLGLIFYLLAKGYCKARGIDTSNIPDLSEWMSGQEGKKPAPRKRNK